MANVDATVWPQTPQNVAMDADHDGGGSEVNYFTGDYLVWFVSRSCMGGTLDGVNNQPTQRNSQERFPYVRTQRSVRVLVNGCFGSFAGFIIVKCFILCKLFAKISIFRVSMSYNQSSFHRGEPAGRAMRRRFNFGPPPVLFCRSRWICRSV